MVKLSAMGVKEVQLHEPALVMWDSSETLAGMFKTAYSAVSVILVFVFFSKISEPLEHGAKKQKSSLKSPFHASDRQIMYISFPFDDLDHFKADIIPDL